jgi:prephenate dehydrogenase
VQLAQATKLWTALGCKVTQMSPQAHDAAYAAVSHLPHLIAFALMNSITAQPEGNDYLSLAGSGFRDFSRIAASDPQMWRDILLANHTELLAQSKLFRQALLAMEKLIASGEGEQLQADIKQASSARTNWQINAK